MTLNIPTVLIKKKDERPLNSSLLIIIHNISKPVNFEGEEVLAGHMSSIVEKQRSGGDCFQRERYCSSTPEKKRNKKT